MSNSNTWKYILVVLAVAGFVWAIDEKRRRELAELKLEQKEKDYLTLMEKYLKDKKSLPQEILDQVSSLATQYSGLDEDVSFELQKVIRLSENDFDETAILSLAKVVENILEEKHLESGKVAKKNKMPSFHSLLRNAKEFNWIDSHEFSFSMYFKEKRNKEAHELAVKFNENTKYMAFIIGLELIYKLKGIKRAA